MTILNQAFSRSVLFGAALAVIASVAVNSSAIAAEQFEPLIKHVTFTDLNVDNADGAKTLYARLRHAAEEVCRPLDGGNFARKNLWQHCYNNALDTAVDQVNRRAVSKLHLQTGSQSRKG